MFFKATFAQTRFMLKQKGALLSFYILLAAVLANFMINVMTFQGTDVIHMYHPMKLLLLSYDRINYDGTFTLFLVQLYPLLVACPAGFSLAKERQTRQEVFITARLGHLPYRLSKLVAGIITTAIVFSLPFFIEIALNCLAFPLSAQGNLSNMNVYDPGYISSVRNYLFHGLYLYSPYLYAVLGTLFFGLLSGVIGGFTVAISSVFRFKYLVFLFLPAFLILNASVYLSSVFGGSGFKVEWYHYFLLFDETVKNPIYLGTTVLVLLIFSIAGSIWGGKRDCVQ